MNNKTVFIIASIFIIVNVLVYQVTELNSQQRIEKSLKEESERLKTHYDILLGFQKKVALNLYDRTIKTDDFLETFKEARYASKEKQSLLREKMQNILYDNYERAKKFNVLQYHFIFPDNTVFLRMHKPSKFGDDLTQIRDDFRYTNETQKATSSFTQGRTAHGFRNTFPVFDKNSKYIGAMEVSFSSDGFQSFLTKTSHIHTHFLVDKKLFDAKAWQRDDMVLKYTQSSEHENLMITMTKEHSKELCIIDTTKKLEPIRDIIDENIAKGEDFSTYVKYNNEATVLSFLAVKNMKNATVAWFVSYTKSDFINFTLTGKPIVRAFAFLLSLLITFFIVKYLRDHARQREDAKEQEALLKQKVKEALEQNTKQLQMLQQQSKMAAMGEMIGAIAHQWRQPLNELGLSIQNLKYDYKAGEIDEAFIKEFIEYNKKIIMFMSKTIDDFRSFFRVDKEKKDFSVKETTESVLAMLLAQLKSHEIDIEISGDEFEYNGLQSEYQQVI
ncbi:MAG: cache domain-containing protein, partial [Campylobacterota bacterium]|nr:cache domain-containing protein [Campylobacterota bacterium]